MMVDTKYNKNDKYDEHDKYDKCDKQQQTTTNNDQRPTTKHKP